jgi:hypothetical protein
VVNLHLPSKDRWYIQNTIITSVNVFDKVPSTYFFMVLITCKKCGDINYLTSETLGNLIDFGYKFRNCNTINRITLEDGELKEQE